MMSAHYTCKGMIAPRGGACSRDRCGSTSSAESSSCQSSQPSSPPDMSAVEDPRRLRQSNSSRYKTELCRAFEEYGTCKYGEKCQFAHGVSELRSLCRHPKYKTELCRTFHTEGFCPYGKRCHFVHTPKDEMLASSPDQPVKLSSGGLEQCLPRDLMEPPTRLLAPAHVELPAQQFRSRRQEQHAMATPLYVQGSEGRWNPEIATPNFNRRTTTQQLSDWQTAQTLREMFNLANSRLPVFSGLGTA